MTVSARRAEGDHPRAELTGKYREDRRVMPGPKASRLFRLVFPRPCCVALASPMRFHKELQWLADAGRMRLARRPLVFSLLFTSDLCKVQSCQSSITDIRRFSLGHSGNLLLRLSRHRIMPYPFASCQYYKLGLSHATSCRLREFARPEMAIVPPAEL